MYRARSLPYGDIFQIPTNAIDNIANKFAMEQKQREAQNAAESKSIDDMFAKNISGIRDEDIPEYTQAYQDYKNAKLGLLRNKLNGNNRIAAELDVQRKLAKVFQIGNNSKEALKSLTDISQRVSNKPDDHVDDGLAMVGATHGVPTSKFNTLTRPDPNGEIDPVTGKVKIVPYNPTDYNSYVDRGNVKDWEQVAKTSLGDYKDIDPIKEDYKDKSGLVLGQTVTPIKATASPTSFMANMSKYIYSGVGRMKHYTNTFKQIYTDDKAQQIASEYYDNAKNNPLWKQAWGENGLSIPPEALANPNTRYLALDAMENAINYPPKLGTSKNVPNVPNMLDQKNAESDRRAKRNFGYSMQKIAANKNGTGDGGDLGYRTDEYYSKYGKSLTSDEEQMVTKLTGLNPIGYVDASNIHPNDMEVITGRNISKKELGIQPVTLGNKEVFFVTPDGNWVGKNGTIDREAVRNKVIETKTNTKYKREEQSKGTDFNAPKVKTTTKSGLPVFH